MANTLLSIAVEGGDYETVKQLIDSKGLDESEGYGYLRSAVYNVHLKIVKFLLENGARNADGRKSEPCLNSAIRSGCKEMVEVLLNHNADVNPKPKKFLKPLFLAADRGYTDICEMLLRKGANVNYLQSYGDLYFYNAVKKTGKNENNIWTDLLRSLPPIKRTSTAIHRAVVNGHTCTVKILIKHGADVNINDEEGYSPIYKACTEGHTDIVKTLLEGGSDLCSDQQVKIGRELFLMIRSSALSSRPKLTFPQIEESIKILSTHLFCMVHDNVDPDLDKPEMMIRLMESFSPGYKEILENEIANMKGENIGGSKVTFFDVLSKSVEQISSSLNESAIAVLKSDDWKNRFPNYATSISNKFDRAVSFKIAGLFFQQYTPLPLLCANRVLSYLTDASVEDVSKALTDDLETTSN